MKVYRVGNFVMKKILMNVVLLSLAFVSIAATARAQEVEGGGGGEAGRANRLLGLLV